VRVLSDNQCDVPSVTGIIVRYCAYCGLSGVSQCQVKSVFILLVSDFCLKSFPVNWPAVLPLTILDTHCRVIDIMAGDVMMFVVDKVAQ
jgi:hypothetical protein